MPYETGKQSSRTCHVCGSFLYDFPGPRNISIIICLFRDCSWIGLDRCLFSLFPKQLVALKIVLEYETNKLIKKSAGCPVLA